MYEFSISSDKQTTHGQHFLIEDVLNAQRERIESWFEVSFEATPPLLTSSVDLRYAGFKLAPVDTNLFPAGFNNLETSAMVLGVAAIKKVVGSFQLLGSIKKIALVPENHTRNVFYNKSFSILAKLLFDAGFELRIASLDSAIDETVRFELSPDKIWQIEPLSRIGDTVRVGDFIPDIVVLNNDLSFGLPPLLDNIEQPIWPPLPLGWFNRLKSTHFTYYQQVVERFSKTFDMDPWLIMPYFESVVGVDFMEKKGLDALIGMSNSILNKIHQKYQFYGIKEKPFLAIKVDNGTYGMGVMMIYEPDDLLQMNRKQRTKMTASKGRQSITRVIVQEGVYSFEKVNNDVGEPVIYMIGSQVIGGFYRVHHKKGVADNLNSPGMYFSPLKPTYPYSVVARLAALAAAEEAKVFNKKEP